MVHKLYFDKVVNKRFVYKCSQQLYSYKPKIGKIPDVFQEENGLGEKRLKKKKLKDHV